MGAVAEFLDISCLAGTSDFDSFQELVFDIFNGSPDVTVQSLIDSLSMSSFVLGQHFFIKNPVTGTGISPVFDFRTGRSQGDSQGFFLGAGQGSLPAPTGKQDVNWLQLSHVQGDLGDIVYRVDTTEGQPPATVSSA